MDGLQMVWWLHFSAAAMMAGIIWFVQMVHYPLFQYVGKEQHPRHHTQHMARTGLLLAPLMLLEMGTGLLLLLMVALEASATFFSPGLFKASMILLGGIWLSTFLVQVRYHRKLDHGKDDVAIRGLVWTNWVRTVLWTARLLLLIISFQS